MHIDSAVKRRQSLAEHIKTERFFGQGLPRLLHKVMQQCELGCSEIEQVTLTGCFLSCWENLNIVETHTVRGIGLGFVGGASEDRFDTC